MYFKFKMSYQNSNTRKTTKSNLYRTKHYILLLQFFRLICFDHFSFCKELIVFKINVVIINNTLYIYINNKDVCIYTSIIYALKLYNMILNISKTFFFGI